MVQPTILIFDSGMGGLSVYYKIKELFPYASYLYVFDNEGFPYSNKSKDFIIKRVIKIISSINKKSAIDIIIIACNTASIFSLSILKKIVSCPIIGVIPPIRQAFQLTKNGIIGLLATKATIESNYIRNLTNQYSKKCKILQLGTTELVILAERKIYGKSISLSVIKKILYSWLIPYNTIPDIIILGCTHFSFIKKEIKSIFPKNVRLIDNYNFIFYRILLKMKNFLVNIHCSKNFKNLNQAYCISSKKKIESLKLILKNHGFLLKRYII